ncbi:MAG: RNA polymerase sigma factor [Bacteroidetes bacterium]|nr:MAG: RNA polymerase sigma factor [Bacteroidota bacterium]
MLNEAQFQQELNGVKDLAFRFALKLTGNYQDAQDLWQESCLRAFRYRDKYEKGTNFKAWLSTIVRNCFITNRRKNARRNHTSQAIESYSYALESTIMVPNEGEANLRMQAIFQQLNKLSELYRIPFLLHYQGYEYKEIAEQLNVPIGTVKSRIFTARRLLKEALTKETA